MIFIGIDSGTQSTKAIALDSETGEILTSAQESYDLMVDCPMVIWSNILRNG